MINITFRGDEGRNSARIAIGVLIYDDEKSVTEFPIHIIYRTGKDVPDVKIAVGTDYARIDMALAVAKAQIKVVKMLDKFFLNVGDPVGASFSPENGEFIGDYINRLGSQFLNQ